MVKQKLLNKQEPSACVVFALKKNIKTKLADQCASSFFFLCNLHAVYLHAVHSQDQKVYKLSLFLIFKFESQAKKNTAKKRSLFFAFLYHVFDEIVDAFVGRWPNQCLQKYGKESFRFRSSLQLIRQDTHHFHRKHDFLKKIKDLAWLLVTVRRGWLRSLEQETWASASRTRHIGNDQKAATFSECFQYKTKHRRPK